MGIFLGPCEHAAARQPADGAGPRPAVRLSAEGLPELHGRAYSECWILSPDYRPGFRPAIGAEVQAEDITGWQVLKITWCDQAAIN